MSDDVPRSSERPRLVFDGDCGFCKRWVLRWQRGFGERVEVRPYQEVQAEHPEVPPEDFRRLAHFFDRDGTAYRGAEAILRALAYAPGKAWMLWAYRRVPGWRPVVDVFYGAVARNRVLASRVTRLLVGKDLTPSTWFLSRRVFLACLGLVYAVAFGSLWVQLDGLVGSEGIQPAAVLLEWAGGAVEGSRWLRVPSLFWLDASDRSLHLLCGAGFVLSLLLIMGLAPRLLAALLWAAYLSFFSVSAPFLHFQWDVLLLETGLLAILFAPGGLRPFGSAERAPSAVVRFLLLWLLFRLMFLSGVVKLASQDEVWWNLTALELHYWTQPLPHRLSHYAHHLPALAHKLSCAVMFAIELGLPFLVFGPRRLRHLAGAGIVLLMVLIVATGNYGFFNLLTVVLCVPLLDDRALRRLPFLRRHREPEPAPPPRLALARTLGLVFFAIVTVGLTASYGLLRIGWMRELPAVLAPFDRHSRPFASFNAYGLFADMTERRPEIEVEWSDDGRVWTPYRFRYKPGAIERPPVFAGLHMPRLDWQMWFAALRGQTARPDPWFESFLVRLLQGSPSVLTLLGENPDLEGPPRYVRSSLYLYRFSSPEERRAGTWWRREERGAYTHGLMRDRDGEIRRTR